MKGLAIAFTSLFVACAHSNTNTVSIPCDGIKVKKPNKNLSYDWTYSIPNSTIQNIDIKNRLSVSSDGTLLINHFSDKDYGKYVCHIKEGDSTVEEVPVDVDHKYIKKPVEQCPSWGCIDLSKCANPDVTRVCPGENEVCCPTMREKDKHRCQHFLGECMAMCHRDLHISRADDCPDGTKCCVLV